MDREENQQKVTQGHPLLRGSKKEGYGHGFSKAQIQSLSAMCETFIPSLPMESRHVSSGKEGPPSKAVQEFYLASGAEFNLPDEVAELLAKRGLKEAQLLVKIMLWLLATRLGTFILCGFLSISWDFPFMHKFADMPLEKREIVLQRWSRETKINPFRMFFLAIKIFSLFLFYSMTDEKSQNPTWKAIGYNLPTNPNSNPDPITKPRPLDKGIIETTYQDNKSLPKTLIQKGINPTNHDTKSLLSIQCDAVICGSGCGGAVAAAILAKSGYKVVIIEKGNYFTSKDYTCLESPSMDQMYENGGVLSTLDAKMMLFAGSTIGGGSAINWSACIKTPDNVLNEWSKHNNLSIFTSAEYSDAMDKVFERLNVTSECSEEGFQNKVLRKGCEKLGLEVQNVGRNSSKDHFCGSCTYGCKTGDKKGADATWLVDAVNHGAIILSGVKAENFILEDSKNNKFCKRKKCVGVMAKSLNPNITYKIEIKANVTISSCGALLTPPLLIKSGLTNPNIGRNLHLHPVVFAWGYFPDQNPNLKGKVFEGGIITSLYKIQNPNSNSNSNPNSSSNSDSNIAIIETPALGPGATASLLPWISGKDMKDRMVKYDRTAHLIILARDTGTGFVQKEGEIKYRLSPKDKNNIKQGLRSALRILTSAGATEIGTHRSDGQRLSFRTTGEDELERFLDEVSSPVGPRSKSEFFTLLSSAHQMGSCRMGLTKEEGAVDQNGESFEAEGLFVCDASLLPGAVGVNPMVTIQSVAICVANGIVEIMKKRKE